MNKKYEVSLIICEIDGGGSHILIKSTINRVKTFLLIDTGASHSIFDCNAKAFCDTKMELIENSGTSSGFNSSIDELYFGDIDSLNISYLRTDLRTAIFTPLDHINDIYKSIKLPVISGIIGCDFLIKYSAIIDFSTSKIMLNKK